MRGVGVLGPVEAAADEHIAVAVDDRHADAGSIGKVFEAGTRHKKRSFIVTAGLVPAIHVFVKNEKTWRPGTRPGMTGECRMQI
jgi:hypothetical protein